jgi:hypothetical protein
MTKSCNTLVVLLLALSVSAFGQLLDPATLHIGTGVGTACVAGCPNVVNNEVTATGGTFDIFQESNQPDVLTNELLLIAAVPNTASGTVTVGSVASASEFDPYTAAAGTPETISAGQTPVQYGNVNPASFNPVTMTNSDVFTLLGPQISSADNSESFTNFNSAYAAEVAAGTPGFSGVPSSYAIYVWSISTTAFSGNSAMNITSTLPVGTFLTAFGESSSHIFSTQFTNTGLVTSGGTTGSTSGQTTGSTSGQTTGGNVPEPGSLILLGSVLFVSFTLSRKKLIRS